MQNQSPPRAQAFIRLALILETRTQAEKVYPAHIWTFSVLATANAASIEVVPKPSAKSPLGTQLSCPTLSPPPLSTCNSYLKHFSQSCFLQPPGLHLLLIFRKSLVTLNSFSNGYILEL